MDFKKVRNATFLIFRNVQVQLINRMILKLECSFEKRLDVSRRCVEQERQWKRQCMLLVL